MPTCTRILLTLHEGNVANKLSLGDESDTHVFDTMDLQREVSTAAAAHKALRACEARSLPLVLRNALGQQLARMAAASPATGKEVGTVELSHGLQLTEARAYGEEGNEPVVEGAAAFHVCEQALGTRLRGLRAVATHDGQTLELLALVHSSSKPEPVRPALHFLGQRDGELKNVQTLQLGKRSNSQVRSGPSSHFLRRGWQLQAHAAAMKDAFCTVDLQETKRAHTLLMDAYVSEVDVAGRALRCVSLFL